MKNTSLVIVFRIALIGFLALGNGALSFAQLEQTAQAAKDAEKYKLLMNHPGIRVTASEALNKMYNFQFNEAEVQFQLLKHQYPTHPLPYFLLGLSNWWKMMPNMNDKRNDGRFIAYMDSSLAMSKALLKTDSKHPEGIFFAAAAWGFKGRLYSEREAFTKAGVAGKNALGYMQDARTIGEFGVEFLFGEGLYNFYREYVPEQMKWIRPFVSVFPRGNKELGIEQLEKTSNEAFFTRVEAQYYLSRIYSNEESTPEKGFPMMKYLSETFPENPYFERQYARMAWLTGRWEEAYSSSEKIAYKVSMNRPGYEANSGRYACFYLGYINYFKRNDLNKADLYFDQANRYAEELGENEGHYYFLASLYRARISVKQDDKASAINFYEKVKDLASKKSKEYKEADEYLRKNGAKRSWWRVF